MMYLTIFFFLSVGFQGNQEQRVCNTQAQQLLDKSGKPVRLNSKQTRKRVIHCENPKLLGNFDPEGSYVVEILIDPEGKVECGKAMNGHPMIRKIAEDTARKWTFKPMQAQGKPVAVYGLVVIHVHWDTEKAKKTCAW